MLSKGPHRKMLRGKRRFLYFVRNQHMNCYKLKYTEENTKIVNGLLKSVAESYCIIFYAASGVKNDAFLTPNDIFCPMQNSNKLTYFYAAPAPAVIKIMRLCLVTLVLRIIILDLFLFPDIWIWRMIMGWGWVERRPLLSPTLLYLRTRQQTSHLVRYRYALRNPQCCESGSVPCTIIKMINLKILRVSFLQKVRMYRDAIQRPSNFLWCWKKVGT
jgi:hypothetical protein